MLALTATAKRSVIDDIQRHYESKLGIEMDVIDAGGHRTNLDFIVLEKGKGDEAESIASLLNGHASADAEGSTIIYCMTQRESEVLADSLRERDIEARAFHASLTPETKKAAMEDFMSGEVRTMVATKAFGMGVDKADVRHVVHSSVKTHGETHVPISAVVAEAHKARADPWGDLVREAIEAWSEEEGHSERVAFASLTGWLHEWSRDLRRAQRGLLLTTAHGAKGLEFDHVVILDGFWHGHRYDEDPDVARRLYYVAMTRARQTLALVHSHNARFTGEQLQRGLSSLDSVCLRGIRVAESIQSAPRRRIRQYGLKDVNIGYAGYWPETHPVHAALEQAQPGDRIDITEKNGQFYIENEQRRRIGHMSKRFKTNEADSGVIEEARIRGVFKWRKDSSGATAGHKAPEVEEWEVVVPEICWKA